MGPSLFFQSTNKIIDCANKYYEYGSNLCNNLRVAVVYPLVFYDYAEVEITYILYILVT